jgi:hypothetical protein
MLLCWLAEQAIALPAVYRRSWIVSICLLWCITRVAIVHLETSGVMLLDLRHPLRTLKELKPREHMIEEMGAAYMANGLITLAGSRMYTSLADTDEVIDDALDRFETVLKVRGRCLSSKINITEEGLLMAEQYKLYKYRWVILAFFMFINLTMQMLWIAYAPITGIAASYYGVTDRLIGLLSMVFMIAFIPLSIPASWMIDKFGYRKAVGLGAVMMAVFGLLRGFAGQNYILVLISTIGIAAAQPFLLNAWTTVPAKWFGTDERATMVGLITLANLVGTGLVWWLPRFYTKEVPPLLPSS